MKPTVFIGLILLGGVLFSLDSKAQMTEDKDISPWQVSFDVSHQDFLIQYQVGQLGVVNPVRIRPSYALGIHRKVRQKKNRTVYLGTQLGYYHNLYHERWVSGLISHRMVFALGDRWQIGMGGNAGIARITSADIQYRFDGEIWVPTVGNPDQYWAGIIAPHTEVGYRLVPGPRPIDVVLQGDVSLQLSRRFWVLPYYSAGIGVRVGL